MNRHEDDQVSSFHARTQTHRRTRRAISLEQERQWDWNNASIRWVEFKLAEQAVYRPNRLTVMSNSTLLRYNAVRSAGHCV